MATDCDDKPSRDDKVVTESVPKRSPIHQKVPATICNSEYENCGLEPTLAHHLQYSKQEGYSAKRNFFKRSCQLCKKSSMPFFSSTKLIMLKKEEQSS